MYNWIEIFEKLDINQGYEHLTLDSDLTEDEREYLNSSSAYKHTIGFLRSFKKKTFSYSDKEKLDYINKYPVQPPNPNSVFKSATDQESYEARKYHYEFECAYKELLERNINANNFIRNNAEEIKVMLMNKEVQDEITKKERYENYILKDFNYSRTLEDFKEKAEINRRALTEEKYLVFLRECKENYGNSSFYHSQYSDNSLGSEHKAIKDFCSDHINQTLNKPKEDTEKKRLIAYQLIGENKFDTIRPVFHHIRKALIENNISSIEAKNILLDMYGAIPPNLYSNVCEPIINYLGQIDFANPTGERNSQDIKNKNQINKLALLDKLIIVNYFETEDIKIQLFFTGNKDFIEQATLDLEEIKEAEKANEKIQHAWRTNGLSIENIHEAHVIELGKLFEIKFQQAKLFNGYKTMSAFAKYEAGHLKSLYSNYFEWFPIFKQWIDFLNGISTNHTIVRNPEIEALEESTEISTLNTQNNFDHIDIRAIYEYFHKNLVEKKHLSDSDLINYLAHAFDKKTTPTKLFQLKNTTTKQKAITIFYGYYKDIAGKPHGKQKQYAALLGDYFEGYKTENVSSNFNK